MTRAILRGVRRPGHRALGALTPLILFAVTISSAGAVAATTGTSAAPAGASGTVSWQGIALPNPKDDIGPVWTGLVCTSVTDCVISGFDDNSSYGALALKTHDGGHAWAWRYHAVTPGVDYELDAVMCTIGSNCLAMGSANSGEELAGSTDGEKTWHPVDPARWDRSAFRIVPESIACSSAMCYVVGIHWTKNTYSVNALVATPNAGRTWRTIRLQAGPVPDELEACDPGTTCWALSTHGELIVSNDGGHSWAPLPSPPFLRQLSGGESEYSCPTAQVCVAITDKVWRSTDGGRTWTRVTSPKGAGPPVFGPAYSASYSVVDCLIVQSCFLVGGWNGTGYLWHGTFG